MDTEKTYCIGKAPMEMAYTELESCDLASMELCVDHIRHLQEIHHLFLILMFQIEQIQRNYTFMSNGNVFRSQFPADKEDDYIAINAHMINITSSEKTMIESMNNFANLNYLSDENKHSYLAMVSKLYDTVFSHKLLIRLRDYSQHGHLPVSSEGNTYYFDFVNILGKPHFNHNKAVKNQMEDAISTCKNLLDDTPRLSLTRTLAEFVATILRIYQNFWMFAECTMLETTEKVKDIVDKYPENVIRMPTAPSEWFVYKVTDGNADMINPSDDPNKMFAQFKDEAKKFCNQYTQAWHELMKGTKIIPIADKD